MSRHHDHQFFRIADPAADIPPGATVPDLFNEYVVDANYYLYGGSGQTSHYLKLSGTSMAAPMLSGAAALDGFLRFADQHEHVDPKTGIPLYGPRSLGTFRHKREVHVGIIGTSESRAESHAELTIDPITSSLPRLRELRSCFSSSEPWSPNAFFAARAVAPLTAAIAAALTAVRPGPPFEPFPFVSSAPSCCVVSVYAM